MFRKTYSANKQLHRRATNEINMDFGALYKHVSELSLSKQCPGSCEPDQKDEIMKVNLTAVVY